MDRSRITEQEILAVVSPKGGWTKKTLAGWSVPWPPPQGWKAALIAGGVPYDASVGNAAPQPSAQGVSALERVMADSAPQVIDGEPFGVSGEIDIDPAKLLRKVVSAVLAAGQGHILYEFPDVLAFFGGRNP